MALVLRRSGEDKKWRELADLLNERFGQATPEIESDETKLSKRDLSPKTSPSQKIVIFTEHRDTLSYLKERIQTLIGKPESIVCIHGSMGREERMRTQEAFRHHPEVRVLIATDAAGEGINLQRAHLMVNYDLPWNPNRLEQRFGRIHRIGQTEVCHLWNLIAEETREGEVYRRLLEKMNEARAALGGQVFDVLGKVVFDGKPLRDLLVEAIRYGEQPEVKARLFEQVEMAFDKQHLMELIEERAIAPQTMDASRVHSIREEMERAEARRLQPHYIESFFREAFNELGGHAREREGKRFEVSFVPATIRERDRLIGIGEPVLSRYERVVFDKSLINPPGQAMAAFVCPGHPLLNATLDLTLERNRDLLKTGSVLVDDTDMGIAPRVLLYMEHTLRDGSISRRGERRTISKRMLYVEINKNGNVQHLNYAPYLDYRSLKDNEPNVEELLRLPEFQWISKDLEQAAMNYAVENVVPQHTDEVSKPRIELIQKTEAAVKERLTKEINYWDHRAEELKLQEQSGKQPKMNSTQARRKADELQSRLKNRLEELQKERHIEPLPPVVIGCLLVVPAGLLARDYDAAVTLTLCRNKMEAAAKARDIVMEVERQLGYEPVDREFDRLGYDIESRVPGTGKLRFIEVKGRIDSAETVCVTRNEVLTSLNKPDDYILAIVAFDGLSHRVHYIRKPFRREPDFGVTSVNYSLTELLAQSEDPS